MLQLASPEPDVLPAPPYVETLVSAGGHVFVLTGGALFRHDSGELTQVAPGSEVRAATASANDTLFAVTDSGSVLEIDPDTLAEETVHPACEATSIAPFGPSKLILACEEGIGVLDPAVPSFAVVSTAQAFALWGGFESEAALLVYGSTTRVFTLDSGAHSATTGATTDAVLTEDAAFAVLSDSPYDFHESRLVQLPFDGSEPAPLLDGYGPMQIVWNGSGDLAASNRDLLWRLDRVTGAQTSEIELRPPIGP